MDGIIEFLVVVLYCMICARVFDYSIGLILRNKSIFSKHQLNYLIGLLGIIGGIFLVYWFVVTASNQLYKLIEDHTLESIL